MVAEEKGKIEGMKLDSIGMLIDEDFHEQDRIGWEEHNG